MSWNLLKDFHRMLYFQEIYYKKVNLHSIWKSTREIYFGFTTRRCWMETLIRLGNTWCPKMIRKFKTHLTLDVKLAIKLQSKKSLDIEISGNSPIVLFMRNCKVFFKSRSFWNLMNLWRFFTNWCPDEDCEKIPRFTQVIFVTRFVRRPVVCEDGWWFIDSLIRWWLGSWGGQ